jgi:NPCBM-associated, NEW3 domain of alpha-galactosidase
MRTKISRWRTMVLLLALALSGAASLYAQGSGGEQAKLVEIRRRQVELKSARSELQRSRELSAQGLISKAQQERIEAQVTAAELNFQQAVLSLLDQEPRLSVRRAVKSQTPDGRRFVEITVVNLTPSVDDAQFRLLANFDGADPIPDALRTRTLNDLFVSLRDTGEPDANGRPVGRGTTIGLPYEVYVPELRYGQSKELRFQLLRDVDSVLVAIAHKGQTQEMDLQLEQAETAHVVDVTSPQISQEADLGGQATFDLRLERSTVDVRSLQLRVLNLPQQISYSFLEPKGEARVSQINFAAGVNQQSLALRLFLPDRADEEMHVDQPLAFWVVVVGTGQVERFAQARRYTPEEIEASRAGSLRLELIPRGVGRIEVTAESLFSEIREGEAVDATIRIRNTGTRRLDNVQLGVEAPLDWHVELTPQLIPALGIRNEQKVRLHIAPPKDTAVGDYEIRVRAESSAYNRRVPSEEKIYRVSVKAAGRFWAIGTVLGGVLLVIGGLAFYGMKLARR